MFNYIADISYVYVTKLQKLMIEENDQELEEIFQDIEEIYQEIDKIFQRIDKMSGSGD